MCCVLCVRNTKHILLQSTFFSSMQYTHVSIQIVCGIPLDCMKMCVKSNENVYTEKVLSR